jgi:UDP-glucose 4-epimerase
MSPNLCITGVSGFIGGRVAEEAGRRGYNVTGVDRVESQAEGIEFVRADVRDKERMRQILKRQEFVIHLAAVTSNVEFVKDPGWGYDTNVVGFLNVMEAAARGDCKRLVFASSAAVYLDTFAEDAPIDVRRQTNHYAKSKLINEMTAESYAAISEMKTIGLRYFNVYGDGENEKGDYASIITLFLRAKAEGAPLLVYGDGKQARDLTNVIDAARVTMELLEKGSDDVYNVGTGVATSYGTIAGMIAKDAVRYVANPLTSYQYYTRAETARLRGVLGDYTFITLENGMKAMRAWQDVARPAPIERPPAS